MNLYLVYRNDPVGYDEFDSFVVTAESEEEAESYAPEHMFEAYNWKEAGSNETVELPYSWSRDVSAKFIGIAAEDAPRGHIIIASFNAG